MLATRKQVHHCNGINQQKWNIRWAHQESQRLGAHAGILKNYAKTVKSSNHSQESHILQWSVRSPDKNNTGWIQNTNRTSTTRHTPYKCSRSGNKTFQVTLPQFHFSYSTGFSVIIVGQTPSTVRNNNQPVASVQCNSKLFVIRPYKRTFWL